MELIACVCLTIATRKDFLQIAVECFRKQTYPNTELVIVADPDCDEAWMRTLAPEATIVMCPEKFVIGKKRNIGCEHSSGAFISGWDDDDFSGPDRLEVQHSFLTTKRKAVTTFKQIPFVQDGQWWIYPPWEKYGIDGSIFFRRDYWASHPFEEIQLGEYVEFIKSAISEGIFEIQRKQDCMYGVNHSGNSSGRNCNLGLGWTKIPRPDFA